jgi:hypothetical protein
MSKQAFAFAQVGELGRHTIPAPSIARPTIAIASPTVSVARPTSIPRFDLADFAKEAAVLTEPPPRMTVSAVVPRLINMQTVPIVSASRHELAYHDLDNLSAFVLLHVDGVSNFDAIVGGCGIEGEDVIPILADLVARGIISIAPMATAANSFAPGRRAISPPPPPVNLKSSVPCGLQQIVDSLRIELGDE